MTQRGRRGRSNAPLRGAHHQTNLDDTPHDSYVSPPCRMRHPCMTEGRPSNANENKDRKGQSAKPLLKEFVQFIRQWSLCAVEGELELLLSSWME